MPQHPAPIIANHLGLISQRLQHSAMTRAAECTFAYVNNAGASPQDLIDAFQGFFNAWIVPELDSNVTAEKPFLRLGDGTNVPHEAIASGSTAIGARSATALPPAVSVVVQRRTNLGGKSNRGRFYIPWALQQSEVIESGQITSGRVTQIQTAVDGFLAAGAAAQVDMVIPNNVLAIDADTGKKYVTAVNHSVNVTTVVTESFVGTQRRRQQRT
jgi:hypothetical protein